MSTRYFDAYTCFGPRHRQHPAYPWTLEHLVDEARHCSISGALVASTACTLYDAMLENHRLSEKLEPFDHLFAIWNVMPHWTGEMPEPDKLLELLEQHNVRAVTLYPKTNGWNIASPTSAPLLEALASAKVLAILDINELAWPELEALAERYPRLPLLLNRAHWAQQRYVLPLVLRHQNLHLTFAHLQANRVIEWLVERGCEDRLLYSSCALEMSMGAHRLHVDFAEVSESVREKIASGNLVRLLKGLAPPRAVVNEHEDAIMAEARTGKPLSTLVLDAHAHILDEGLEGAGGAYAMFDGGPRGVRRLARRMGVDGIGVMSWNGTVGVHADDGNRCTLAALDAFPDFYWGLGSFDVVHDDADTQRRKMEALFADKRFLGLKPYPHYGVHYDDKRFEVWWQFGNERDLYAGLHPNRGDLSEFDALCPKYPNMTFVAYHCGGSYQAADAAIALAGKHPNFLAEITLTPVCLGVIDYLVAGCGAERVLYGSDLPMRDPRPQLGWVVYSRISVDDKKRVLGGNTQRLLERIRRAG